MIDVYDKKHPDDRIKDKKKKEEIKPKVTKQVNSPKRGSKIKKVVTEKLHHRSKAAPKKEEKSEKAEKIDKLEKQDKKEEKEKEKNTNANILVKPDFDESSSYPCEPDYVVKLDIHLDGKLQAQVKWINKTVTAIDYEDFKMRYPQKLIEFFESRIVFPFENSGTRKFLDIHKKKED